MTLPWNVRTHLSAGQPAAALHVLTEHLSRHPIDAPSWDGCAEALLALHRPEEAVEAATQAVRYHDIPQHQATLATALARAGRTREAVAVLRQILSVEPMWADAWERIGIAFEALGELETALHARREAVRRDPRNLAMRLRLAERLERADQRDEARTLVTAVLARGRNTVAERILMRIDHHDGRLDEAAARGRRILRWLPPDQQIATWMELARIEARRGHAAEAFGAAGRGNALALRRWIAAGNDPDALPRALAALADEPVGPFPPSQGGDGAAFLVGFPRSGTTLTQQILHAHPGLRTLDEQPLVDRAVGAVLPGADLPTAIAASRDPVVAAAIRQHWWTGVESRLPPGDGLVMDKLPLNLLRVELLARAFPGAPIVVVLRDPRDAVLSAFLQDFELNGAMAQCADLRRCADLYAQAFSRWLRVRAELPAAIEVRYEDLVADPEPTLRRVVGHLGLPWSDAVLDHVSSARRTTIGTPSYRDVRQPLYARSVGRWTGFAAQLAPVLPTLAPFVEAFGYAA